MQFGVRVLRSRTGSLPYSAAVSQNVQNPTRRTLPFFLAAQSSSKILALVRSVATNNNDNKRRPLQGGLHNCKMRLVTFDTLDWIIHDLIQHVDNEKDKEHENFKKYFDKV